MNSLSPAKAMQEVVGAVPESCRPDMIIVGSLAAAYHFFGQDPDREVRTKDVDCLLSPRDRAPHTARDIATQLLEHGWTHRTAGGFGRPQESPTPVESLSAIRLRPPGSAPWFLELMVVPESEHDHKKTWISVRLTEGYFGLPSMEFFSLLAWKPHMTALGIRYARPEMMVLANLFSHPAIGPETMSSLYEERAIKRSNKDLGRAVALARLSSEQEVASWPAQWREALQACFPSRWRARAAAGSGLRARLASGEDLREALLTCTIGLLAREQITADQFRATGLRLLREVIEPFESLAG
jgi:hypothetical protein